MAGVSVALSGGGHRASLFGLGVLMYLADAEVNHRVSSVASVSGGSLTNGYVAQQLDYQQVTGPEFETAMRPFARQLATKGTLFATMGTKVYLVVLGVTALVALVGPWFAPGPGIAQAALFVGALLAWASLVFGRRGAVCARAFARTLFSLNGPPTRLSQIHHKLDHVFCATDLQSAEQVYFGADFVYGYRYGRGTPGDTPVHVAVQASACLPGAFPPKWLPTRDLSFRYQTPDCPPTGKRPPSIPSHLVLVDGGVYDNMADQWGQGFAARVACWPTLPQEHHQPDVLIVANASAGLEWTPFKRALIPAVGEVLALSKDKDVLYDQTTAVRRHDMVARFDLAAQTGHGLRGALVHIAESPFVVPNAFANGADQGRAARAHAVLAALGDSEVEWADVAARNTAVGTVLSKLGVEVSARLIRHAYVLAMVNCHVLLDTPLLPVPQEARFVQMTS